jgi:hypothetical protein
MNTTYRIHGVSDDTDTCEVCGRTHLRSVVMLEPLEHGEPTGELLYAGSTCAARKLACAGRRLPARRIHDAAAAASTVWAQAREFVAEFEGLTFNAFLRANQEAAQRWGAQHMRNAFDSYTAEIGAVKFGTLAGTRWESKLPVL